jgi:predicted permease
VFGLTPALQAADRDIAARVRDGSPGSGTRRGWVSNALVGGQLALSLVLLVGAGLFVRALDRGNRIDPGFDARGVATAQFNTDSWAYGETRARAFYRDLRERVAALPGVTAVSFTEYLPLTTRGEGTMVKVDGSAGPATDATNGMYSGRQDVDAGYFDALRTTIVAGRAIDRTDDASAPKVAVVNETFVRRTWPGQSAVGRTVGYQGDRVTVVGVARDAKYSTLTEPLRPFLYLPIAQHWSATQTLVVRASGDPLALAPDIARAVRAIDPTLPRPTVTTLGRENSVALIPQRVAALVSGTLGAVGLLLAAVGLYGVISHSSSRRRREIGIRLALGARRGDVLQMILREGMRVTAIGVAIGLVLSTAATRLLVRYLFGVSPLDALTFVVMSAMFVGIAALASYLPARRAASLSPMLTLRDE